MGEVAETPAHKWGASRPMGTAAEGGKGSKGRAAVRAERPIGAAGCRQQRNQASCPPCGDTWVCQVVIAIKGTAQATALHSQKEIKADHEPESPVLGAFPQCLHVRHNSRSLGNGEQQCGR